MKLSPQKLWLFGAIAVGTIALIVLFAAPNNPNRSGSTYSRDPSGYGAWYAFMEKRETPIQRWQKPFSALTELEDRETGNTLLRVYSGLATAQQYPFEGSPTPAQDWVKRGNRLVILGIRQPVTEAPFSSQLESEAGFVRVDTGRRADEVQNSLLGDRFGTVAWSKTLGKGQIVYVIPPHLAANAYQNSPGNYEFLAQLVTGEGLAALPAHRDLWVDEYIHGYQDAEAIAAATEDNVLSYWAKTPLLPAAIQGAIFILVAIVAGNRRLGKAISLSSPVANNSQAYIEALAGVLQKAESHEFVLEVLGKEEQRQLQQALGLGSDLLEPQVLVEEWVQQTGKSAKNLEQLLLAVRKKQRLGEKEVLGWLEQWRNLHPRN